MADQAFIDCPFDCDAMTTAGSRESGTGCAAAVRDLIDESDYYLVATYRQILSRCKLHLFARVN
jgi:hypothetical protein